MSRMHFEVSWDSEAAGCEDGDRHGGGSEVVARFLRKECGGGGARPRGRGGGVNDSGMSLDIGGALETRTRRDVWRSRAIRVEEYWRRQVHGGEWSIGSSSCCSVTEVLYDVDGEVSDFVHEASLRLEVCTSPRP